LNVVKKTNILKDFRSFHTVLICNFYCWFQHCI